MGTVRLTVSNEPEITIEAAVRTTQGKMVRPQRLPARIRKRADIDEDTWVPRAKDEPKQTKEPLHEAPTDRIQPFLYARGSGKIMSGACPKPSREPASGVPVSIPLRENTVSAANPHRLSVRIYIRIAGIYGSPTIAAGQFRHPSRSLHRRGTKVC
jgi:hypothetical protein